MIVLRSEYCALLEVRCSIVAGMIHALPRSVVGVLALAMLSGCQFLQKKDKDGDAAAGAVTADGVTAAPSAKAEPPLPTTFELVAVGKRSGAKIVWLRSFGDRVWLSGMGLDAFADGDGPLGSGSDLTAGLPQKPQENGAYTGQSPLLFALRAQPETFKSDDPPIVSVRDGKGSWSSGKKVRYNPPHTWLGQYGFVPWKDGALYMYSQADIGTSMMYFANEPGTRFQTISPKGDIEDTTFDVPKEVMAWSADSDGSTLALVGHRVQGGKSLGISVFRGKEKGAFTETPIIDSPATQDPGMLLALMVREQTKVALAYQTRVIYAGTPMSNLASTLYVIADNAKEPKKIEFAPPGKGAIPAAAYVGGSVYATVEHPKDHFTLMRAADGAAPAPVKLPSLAKGESGFRVAKDGEAGLTCEATNLFARKNDLWIQASCSGQGMKLPAVFRLGHPQEPIQLP